MKITYVTEDTGLWGGIAVIFQHLELLAEAGHEAFLTTPATRPDWYNLKVPVMQIKSLEPRFIPPADIIVATSWRLIKPVMESKKGIPVHLCQGYEASLREWSHLKDDIDRAYFIKLPRLTVSPHLKTFLEQRFNAEVFYIGQMIDREIFHPVRNPFKKILKKRYRPLNVLSVGPFEGSYKNIPTILHGIILARKKLAGRIRLTRVSQFPISKEEKGIVTPDAYHLRIPYQDMGDIYRGSDIFISMSTYEEGFGLPALEAMACGVPVILSRIPSHLGFDIPQDFAVFAEFSPEAVSEAIQHLYKDAKTRHRLTKRGLSVAGKFTKEAVLSRLTRAFEDILSEPESCDT